MYSPNSVENLILTGIHESNHEFYYTSSGELDFEVSLRALTIRAATDLYNSKIQFAVFRKTKCNDFYFDRQSNGGFKKKSNVSSYEAIHDIFNNGYKYATECATAIVIVYYKALSDMFGKKAFDREFNQITLMNWHSLDSLIREIGFLKNKSYDIPSDRRYFKNPDVDIKTPEWQGENVIDLGNNTYYGHGIGIHNKLTIIKKLNNNRKKSATESAYLVEDGSNPDFKKLFKVYKKYDMKTF